MEKKFTIPIPVDSQPYNFNFFLTHYVFQPWVVEDKRLIRLFKLKSKKFVLVCVEYNDKPKLSLEMTLLSDIKLEKDEIIWLRDMISWIFAVNDNVSYFYETICQKDPVLKAASQEIYGAHLRTDPTVFESVLGVVMAQNVFFKRIYEMTKLLCQKFGESKVFNGKTYYTFPTPERLAKAELSEIRSCKVGYRDKYIKGVAKEVVQKRIDLDRLRELEDNKKIREALDNLPGVGPYTADLTIAISFRRPVFHLDLFSREAMYTFYFRGKKVSDQKITEYADKHWGKWKHYVMLLLTTNTDIWSKDLGKSFRLKSAAKSPSG